MLADSKTNKENCNLDDGVTITPEKHYEWTGESDSTPTHLIKEPQQAAQEPVNDVTDTAPEDIIIGLDPDVEHALRMPEEGVKTIDNRTGEKLKSQTCKVCGGHDFQCASSKKFYQGGCMHCRNIVDGQIFFPARPDEWYKPKGVYGSESRFWKAFVTTYRKELVRLKMVKPLAALLLEHMADRSSRGGVFTINKTLAATELGVANSDTIRSALKHLVTAGAIRELEKVVSKSGSAKEIYAIILSPLEKSDKAGAKQRINAFLKSVVPPREESGASEASQRYTIGEASSTPITKH